MEMLNSIDRTHFASPNEALPSKSIENCAVCPAWQFSSIREVKRHISILHPNYEKVDIPRSASAKIFMCKQNRLWCSIPNAPPISKHKTENGHFVRKRPIKENMNQAEKRGKVAKTSYNNFLRSRKRSTRCTTSTGREYRGGDGRRRSMGMSVVRRRVG